MAKTGSDSFIQALGLAIRERREAADMSLEDFGYKADLTSRHLFEIEKARTNPKIETLFEIAEAFNIKLSDLIREAEKRRNASQR